MDVIDAEVAWNGSAAGGIADVNNCVITYRNCEVHHNLGAAFFFAGKSHRVTDTRIHNQAKDFVVRGNAVLHTERIVWEKPTEN